MEVGDNILCSPLVCVCKLSRHTGMMSDDSAAEHWPGHRFQGRLNIRSGGAWCKVAPHDHKGPRSTLYREARFRLSNVCLSISRLKCGEKPFCVWATLGVGFCARAGRCDCRRSWVRLFRIFGLDGCRCGALQWMHNMVRTDWQE